MLLDFNVTETFRFKCDFILKLVLSYFLEVKFSNIQQVSQINWCITDGL